MEKLQGQENKTYGDCDMDTCRFCIDEKCTYHPTKCFIDDPIKTENPEKVR